MSLLLSYAIYMLMLMLADIATARTLLMLFFSLLFFRFSISPLFADVLPFLSPPPCRH